MSRYQASAARARARLRGARGEHDLLLGDYEGVGPHDLAGAPRVLDRHEEGMRSERFLGREPQHGRAKRREHARHRRPGHARAVRAEERVVVHRVQVGGHPCDGLLVVVSARVHLPRVADAETEQEAVVKGVCEHASGVRRRDGVASPDVRYAGGDADALGRREQHSAVRERLARTEPLRVPERAVPELLDLPYLRPRLRGGRDGERAAPDPDPAKLQARGHLHETGLLALTSEVTISFPGATSPTSRAAGGIAPLITSISHGRPASTSSSIDGRASGIFSPKARA